MGKFGPKMWCKTEYFDKQNSNLCEISKKTWKTIERTNQLTSSLTYERNKTLSSLVCGSCIDCCETCLGERDYNEQEVIKLGAKL